MDIGTFELRSDNVKKKSIVFGFNFLNKELLFQYSNIAYFVDNNIKNKSRYLNGAKIISSKEFNENFIKAKALIDLFK